MIGILIFKLGGLHVKLVVQPGISYLLSVYTRADVTKERLDLVGWSQDLPDAGIKCTNPGVSQFLCCCLIFKTSADLIPSAQSRRQNEQFQTLAIAFHPYNNQIFSLDLR